MCGGLNGCTTNNLAFALALRPCACVLAGIPEVLVQRWHVSGSSGAMLDHTACLLRGFSGDCSWRMCVSGVHAASRVFARVIVPLERRVSTDCAAVEEVVGEAERYSGSSDLM